MLIVGDSIIKRIRFPNAITHCFPGATIPILLKKLPGLLVKLPASIEKIVVHIGTNDTSRCNSEILKADFMRLVDYLHTTNLAFFLSGPISRHDSGDAGFSRVASLNSWLKRLCRNHDLPFIDNFNLFWCRFSFLERDRLHPNKWGSQALTANFIVTIRNYDNTALPFDTTTDSLLPLTGRTTDSDGQHPGIAVTTLSGSKWCPPGPSPHPVGSTLCPRPYSNGLGPLHNNLSLMSMTSIPTYSHAIPVYITTRLPVPKVTRSANLNNLNPIQSSPLCILDPLIKPTKFENFNWPGSPPMPVYLSSLSLSDTPTWCSIYAPTPTHNTIPVIITHRPNISQPKQFRRPFNLTVLNTDSFISPCHSLLNGCLWNARSITSKSLIVNNFITSHELDFMFLVETWQDTDVHLIEACPPGYSFWNGCRSSGKGGGGWLLFIELVSNAPLLILSASHHLNSFPFLPHTLLLFSV